MLVMIPPSSLYLVGNLKGKSALMMFQQTYKLENISLETDIFGVKDIM